MKNGIGIAIITFIAALGVGLFKNPNWMIAVFRAIFSAVIALAGNAMILALIQRFLPELLLNPQQESEDDIPFGSLNKDALNETGDNDDNVGQSINIVLDENNASSASSLGQSPANYSGSENFAATNFSSSSFSLPGDSSGSESSIDQKKQLFLREDPSILAKMVRTRLSDED